MFPRDIFPIVIVFSNSVIRSTYLGDCFREPMLLEPLGSCSLASPPPGVLQGVALPVG